MTPNINTHFYKTGGFNNDFCLVGQKTDRKCPPSNIYRLSSKADGSGGTQLSRLDG